MNQFDQEENVWGDEPSPRANQGVSVLLNTDDNPYATDFGAPALDEVDFHSGPNIYNELSDTMRSIHLQNPAPEEAEQTEETEQPQESVESAAEQAHQAELVEHAKQRNKQLLSSLVATDHENPPLTQSLLEETPDENERLFTAGNDGPLDSVLDFNAPISPPRQASDDPHRLDGVTSPNKKTRLFRPRRGRKTTTEASNPLDPLSQKPQEEQAQVAESRKESLIAAVDKPLFDIQKAQSPIKPTLKAPEQTEPADHFEIIVGDPIKVGELTNAHIVYSITTKSKSSLLKEEVSTVTRRYKDFLWLYNQLMNNHPGYIIPPPPEKQAYGRFDEKFIENRRLALEKMLIKISKVPVLQKDYDFIIFLQSDRFATEAKEREFLYYHGTTGDDQSILQGEETASDFSASSLINSASPGANGGFLSSLIGLNTPKYIENDQFILDKQAYVEAFDQQLRALSKTLDFILEKREDVIISMNELIIIVQQLTDLEVNGELSELFSNYEELQTKVKELLERTNMQQILTLGTTIDEYIRTIGSIRNCFEMRFKLCNSLVSLQSQHSKKQKNLIKFKTKNHNQLEKIKRYEEELSSMENTITKQEEFKLEFNKNLKRELDKFEFEKVEDFKSTVEIYWEGLIESQKELIELWESFYDKCKFQDD
ncbi:hypothetical protein OGAPHI_000694 [Ogataea philodendri]|uniref:PX domain-containing protein n=1 Tax=Ogataea philodendri TaxID=1378263 RepID=A0A9P8T952_9ASCO|nr:uncharacterized protein OGAPHI_000694 [Ogataea philodendri]KAH3670983.1 hypothetical protein OGAPHI_000694 [Ogataea philodendri]